MLQSINLFYIVLCFSCSISLFLQVHNTRSLQMGTRHIPNQCGLVIDFFKSNQISQHGCLRSKIYIMCMICVYQLILLPQQLRGCPHMMSDNFRGFQTPPPPLVSICQHLLDPPYPPRQPSSYFGRPPSTNAFKEKTLFDITLQGPFDSLGQNSLFCGKPGSICLFYTHLLHFKTD